MAEKKPQQISSEDKKKIFRSYGFSKEKVSSRRMERIARLEEKGK